MKEFLTFAFLGIGLGSLYSLASQGLLVVYRGSGILNFAQGAVGMVGAYIYWELDHQHGLPYGVALILGVAASALIGALTQVLIMGPLRRSAPLVRIVATLGLLIVLQAAVILRYGSGVVVVHSELPTTTWHILGGVAVQESRMILLGIAVVITAVLFWAYRYTSFGRATAAVSQNQRSAAALGWSPDLIATANWALGAGLGGLAAVLIAPIAQLQASTMTNLVLAAMAAALIASFRSFPICLLAGVLLGIGQTEIQNYWDVHVSGLSPSFPFIVIVLVMIVRGQALPLRDAFLQRLPAVGRAHLRPIAIILGIAIYSAGILALDKSWVNGFITTFGFGLVLLSIVVLTGYTGQISLCQFALAGVGAYIASRLVSVWHWPFELGFIAGIVGTVPVGMIFALPAVRARGVNLAIVTLGLGTAVNLLVFNSGPLTGGFTGTVVPHPKIFGYDIFAVTYPQRYAFFGFVLFILAAVSVSSIRRSRTGRQLIAVRTNERAAAALGINVRSIKLYAFGVAAAIAAAGGILIAFENKTIFYGQFDPLTSINAMAWAVIGGVGFIHGASVGAWFAPGALGTVLGDKIYGNLGNYILLIGGGFLLLTVLQTPNGVAAVQAEKLRPLGQMIGRRVKWLWAEPKPIELPTPERQRVAPKTLRVDNLVVRYGRVTAVAGFSTEVRPGTVVGLIGPNGAGKTSVIDGITGFTTPTEGRVYIDEVDVTGTGVAQRAQMGLSRSFQSLELFEDLTVLENLRTAADPRDKVSYLRDLVYPVNPPLPGTAVAAITEFRLGDDLDRVVENLSYGQRRLLAIARAVAISPSILLLDEPAAGLGESESRELAQLVRRLCDDWGMSILLIEHDMDFVMSICDHIEVLDFGKQIATGTPAEIKSNPHVVAAYLGVEDPEEAAQAAEADAMKGAVG
ncbi:MAG: ATP-binding cassette domain-containing protein [Actinobacteria bacterium]|nr:ATP-binding cassette domain-containing protein [Actinomycetota bacterium]